MKKWIVVLGLWACGGEAVEAPTPVEFCASSPLVAADLEEAAPRVGLDFSLGCSEKSVVVMNSIKGGCNPHTDVCVPYSTVAHLPNRTGADQMEAALLVWLEQTSG